MIIKDTYTYRILGILFLGLTLSRGKMNYLKRYFDGIIFLRMDLVLYNVIRFWRARFIQKLVNEGARCVFLLFDVCYTL